MPKVSVITPVYNGERYIRLAINSLLAQSFQDWELIVVDDGSSDSTPRILDGYTDNRIIVIHQKNFGEANARNTGLDHTNGEYMAFLDADDEYLPNALEDLSHFLDIHQNYSVVFSDGLICDSQDKVFMRITEARPGIFTGNILNELIISPSVVSVPVCTMTRISKVQEYGLRFDEKSNFLGTDWDFWIRLAVHVEFGYLDKITCKYRIHTTNLTRVTGSEKRKKDQIYSRMKIMTSEWFVDLSLATKKLFFQNLLVDLTSGDSEMQLYILNSNQFNELPMVMKSEFWRRVGIDVLQKDTNVEHAKYFFQKSIHFSSEDKKTRFLLLNLIFGREFSLLLIKLWHLFIRLKNYLTNKNYYKTKRLQKILS